MQSMKSYGRTQTHDVEVIEMFVSIRAFFSVVSKCFADCDTKGSAWKFEHWTLKIVGDQVIVSRRKLSRCMKYYGRKHSRQAWARKQLKKMNFLKAPMSFFKVVFLFFSATKTSKKASKGHHECSKKAGRTRIRATGIKSTAIRTTVDGSSESVQFERGTGALKAMERSGKVDGSAPRWYRKKVDVMHRRCFYMTKALDDPTRKKHRCSSLDVLLHQVKMGHLRYTLCGSAYRVF